MKHNYTNELELKSIIIRIQTARKLNKTTGSSKTIAVNSPKNIRDNRKINKYIKLVSNLSKKSDIDKSRLQSFKAKVTDFIIKKSENTPIDNLNYERFGFIIMEMVRHILTKPQFRGYTYYDDFMSDSVFKILKYLDNFDHTIISKRSGEPVKAFAYISQIITNSIIFIISKNKKEQDFIKQQLSEAMVAALAFIPRNVTFTLLWFLNAEDTLRAVLVRPPRESIRTLSLIQNRTRSNIWKKLKWLN